MAGAQSLACQKTVQLAIPDGGADHTAFHMLQFFAQMSYLSGAIAGALEDDEPAFSDAVPFKLLCRSHKWLNACVISALAVAGVLEDGEQAVPDGVARQAGLLSQLR